MIEYMHANRYTHTLRQIAKICHAKNDKRSARVDRHEYMKINRGVMKFSDFFFI